MESIAQGYLEAVRTFKSLLRALSEPNCRAVNLGQVEVSSLSEDFGRLRTWGDQTRASLQESARGSLDHVLRHNDAMKETVKGILSRLQSNLDLAIPIARRSFDSLRGSDQDSISSVSADSGPELDENEEQPQESRRVPMIRFLAGQIHDQIQSLYYLSVTIRRPGVVNRYLSSTDRTRVWHLHPFFEEHDLRHVAAKIIQWKGLARDADPGIPDEEPAAPIEISTSSPLEQLPDNMRILAKRLAGANTKRREQLHYWTHHPDMSNMSNKRETRSDRSLADDQSDKTLTQGSLLSQALSGVAGSDMENTSANNDTDMGQEKTIYEPSVIGSGLASRVPDIPQAAHSQPHFECPYCHQNLDSEPLRARQNWKRHVFRDLRPYVCTFTTCQTPEKLYATRHEWIYHEMQMHLRRWKCEDCDEEYTSRQAMEQHIRSSHPQYAGPRQLQIMLDIYDRPMDCGAVSCPLCSAPSLSLRQRHSHVAQHMEDIALFTVPGSAEEEDESRSVSEKSNQQKPDSGRLPIVPMMITSHNSGIPDSRHQVQSDPERFFSVGRVFSVLLHENPSSPQISPTAFGERAFFHIRRFVVIKGYPTRAWCFEIYTYGNRGMSKYPADASKHAVIYIEGALPTMHPEEPQSVKIPLEVRLVSADERLSPMSRLNFGKIFTVEYGVKVRPIGRITDKSMPYFLEYARGEMSI